MDASITSYTSRERTRNCVDHHGTEARQQFSQEKEFLSLYTVTPFHKTHATNTQQRQHMLPTHQRDSAPHGHTTERELTPRTHQRESSPHGHTTERAHPTDTPQRECTPNAPQRELTPRTHHRESAPHERTTERAHPTNAPQGRAEKAVCCIFQALSGRGGLGMPSRLTSVIN